MNLLQPEESICFATSEMRECCVQQGTMPKKPHNRPHDISPCDHGEHEPRVHVYTRKKLTKCDDRKRKLLTHRISSGSGAKE